MTSKPCPFCTLPSERVVEQNEHAFWIYDGFPVSVGHSLIIPMRHVGSFFETNLEERLSMFALLDRAKVELEKAYGPDAFNIGINDGAAAGQTVTHLHLHLIPRYTGDVDDPRGGVRWVVPELADYWSAR